MRLSTLVVSSVKSIEQESVTRFACPPTTKQNMPEQTTNPQPAVLLIENDAQTPRSIREMLAASYRVVFADSEAEAILAGRQTPPAAIIFNLTAPVLELLDRGFRIRAAAQLERQTPIIVISWRGLKIVPLGNNVYVGYISDFSQLEELLVRLGVAK